MNATAAELFWWVVLPYLALGVFIVGHVWRWRYDQFGWTSRSTQLQERRLLKWGGPLFHYGTFAAIGGHVIGVLIPERWTKAIGIPEDAYRWFSAGAGTLAAVLVIGGVAVLASRRLFVARVRATTAPIDYVTLILLLVVILTGIAPTIGVNLFGHGYDYRTTVAPWFRGLFSFAPDTSAIAHAPFIYQLHATAAWVIWGLWPFSRWLLWVVGTQSLSVTASTLVPAWPSQSGLLAPAAVGLWSVGLVLYLLLVSLILLRWLTVPMTPETLGPPYWILMGATAITVLAGARILGLPAALPVTRATAGFVEGFSFVLWAFGTWWIPLLIVLGLWRHVRRHWPLTYEPTLWSVVFPSACTAWPPCPSARPPVSLSWNPSPGSCSG